MTIHRLIPLMEHLFLKRLSLIVAFVGVLVVLNLGAAEEETIVSFEHIRLEDVTQDPLAQVDYSGKAYSAYDDSWYNRSDKPSARCARWMCDGRWDYVVAVNTGVAFARIGQAQTSPVIDDNTYTYFPDCKHRTGGMAGVFLGVQKPTCDDEDWALRFGVAYNYISPWRVCGRSTAGIDASSVSIWNYTYKVRSQQLLADLRLVWQRHWWHGYVGFVGGGAFNKSYGFKTASTEIDPTLAPQFQCCESNRGAVGANVGVEFELCEHASLGLGYQFVSAGRAGLGQGGIIVNDTVALIPFCLKQRHLHIHELVVQLTATF